MGLGKWRKDLTGLPDTATILPSLIVIIPYTQGLCENVSKGSVVDMASKLTSHKGGKPSKIKDKDPMLVVTVTNEGCDDEIGETSKLKDTKST